MGSYQFPVKNIVERNKPYKLCSDWVSVPGNNIECRDRCGEEQRKQCELDFNEDKLRKNLEENNNV